MPIIITRHLVRSWYPSDASFSIELMSSFVDGVEKQATDSITKYRTARDFPDGHQGLDNDTFDLNEIFEEYFPSLQRRSALLAVWGFLEHQLNELCGFYQREKKLRLSYMELSGKGIDRSTDYLEKVAGLQGLKASEEWYALKAIQRIRNVIVHANGRLPNNEESKSKIMAAMAKLGFLTGDEEIVVAEGFLLMTVLTCNKYFKLIEKAIWAEQGA